MEKSIVKKEWGGMRLLPLWFALVGLVCASWLSIGSEKPALKSLKDKVKSDTSIVEKEGEKLKRIDSYRSETDHEDEAMPEDILQHGPAIADMLKGFAFEGLDAPAIAFGPWPGDSIPGFGYVPTEEWAVFEKEFTEKFREEFKEFFEKNRPQFEKMMEELRKQHHNFEGWSLDGDELLRDQLRAMEEFRYINPPIPNPGNFTAPGVFVMPFPDSGALLQGHAEQLDLLERAIEDMSHNEDLLHSQEGLMALDEMLLRRNEAALDEYEQAMIKQLISDGYLSQDEGIKNLKIHDDEITINGKKVQEKDLKKYKEIMEKYQPVWSTPRRPE